MPKYSGGVVDLSRRTKLAALHEPASSHFGRAFWPTSDEVDLFQPEPGCSEPTFVASAIDVGFHASALLNLALARMPSLDLNESSADFVALPPQPVGTRYRSQTSFSFANVRRFDELHTGYEVLVAPGSHNTIESEIARSRRERDAEDETGGLLFGAIDDSLERIYIDAALGPPPDSVMSPERFECGTVGAATAATRQKVITRGSSSFVGIWHTHPVSPPKPSEIDLGAMVSILHLQEPTPRHVVMLIVGHSASRPVWAFYRFRRKDFSVEVVERAD